MAENLNRFGAGHVLPRDRPSSRPAEGKGHVVKIPSPTVSLLTGAALAVAFLVADLNIPSKQEAYSAGAETPAPSTATKSSPASTPKPSATTAKAKPTATTPAKAAAKAPKGALVAVAGTPRLGGNASDWSASAIMSSTATVSGHDTGVTADWQVLWDQKALYLRATVHDPQIVQPFVANPGQLFRGDSVNLELGKGANNLSAGARLRTEDGHYLFGPRPGGGLVTAVNPAIGGTFVDGKADRRVRAIERPIKSGYVVEMAIPWNMIGATPAPGRVLAANLNVSDGSQAGVLRNMKSTNPRRTSKNQSHPGTWQVLKLRG
jgi:hypothetical protein